MKSRPTIFLSGVSHEFGTFRDAVENEVQMKGCFPLNQPSFAPDYRSVEEMLTPKLTEADAVICIVGFRYGAEPNQRPADKPRRSYTQMEFDIAGRLEKPVFVFISQDASVRQSPTAGELPEDDEAVRLQLAHRDAVTKTNHLFYFFKDGAELCKLVAQIPPLAAAGFHADISRVDNYAPAELIGRDHELTLLNDAWAKVRRAESPRPHILTFVALGGEGKTSLVAKWAAELAHQDWPGCDAVFAWSFYTQGTRQQTVSSDAFLKEALTAFGNQEMAGGAQLPLVKGEQLAKLVGQRRALLILDGLEPLQSAPSSPTPGELTDQGLAALLKGLAGTSRGLCVVTTRYAIPDLSAYRQTTAPQHELLRLSTAAGVRLLRTIGVKAGSEAEFEKLVEDVDGHALTLQILGQFLVRAHRGDIRRRDRISFEKADRIKGGHAFRAMDAYAKWMENDSDESRREVALLNLLGLFDRPATSDCVAALQQAPAIPGLTDPLVGLAEDDLDFTITSLSGAKLLTVNQEEGSGALVALDAHPLVREYFARRVRKQPEAWRAAHQRLYEHLCATTPDKPEPTLEDLQPLYQAVAHGCHAGLLREALFDVYDARIARPNKTYAVTKLGAFGSDLGAVTCFFETPWSRVSPVLAIADQAWMLNNAGFCLRALGRLNEAREPMQAGLELCVQQENWVEASKHASNLSELQLMLGQVARAVENVEQSMIYADRSGEVRGRKTRRARLADALHQAGRRAEADRRFGEAEEMQAKSLPNQPLLSSLSGFQYCDLLIAAPERAAWQHTCSDGPLPAEEAVICKAMLQSISQRATRTLDWAENDSEFGPLSIALDHLTLGRAALYAAILEESEVLNSKPEIESAVAGLRRASQQHLLVLGLLTRAWLRRLTGAHTGPESAQSDLDEALEMAERGPMKLLLADIHLHRARLFGAGNAERGMWNEDIKYPWKSPAADLAATERLINECGYHRRDDELADAKTALLGS